ncbi:thioether cross-link-forming SCIFF peptide maturase [Bacteroidia bacterium]|nr:thioether cross-link-forming SCIFF peptide maturase [Bacteroidia bacterium]
MNLSAEVFVIPLEADRYLVYAPLRRAAFVGNAQTVNFLADLKAGHYNAALDADGATTAFLSRLEIVNAGAETQPIATTEGVPEPTAVTLFLTTACNLRCTYCYASAGDHKASYMPMAVAKRGIDFVIGNAVKRNSDRVEVHYHGGGEPTMHWRVLTESCAYARQQADERGLTLATSTATNGVLSERQTDWLIANMQGVSLSLDGMPEAQDKHRLTKSGKGSSRQVIRTLRRFDEAKFPHGIRMTVTADLIPFLADSVEYICSHFHAQRIQVEPAYQIGRWTDAPTAETEAFITAYREAQHRAQQHGSSISFSAARLGVLTNHFCAATQDGFALSPNGSVSSCYEVFSEDNPWEKVFFYGKQDETGGGYQFDLERLNFLRKQAVQHREYCSGCFARWTCAGDCYHKSLTVTGSLEFAGSDRCNITRELTKDLILARIAESGGLFWHELPEKSLGS